jgi:hypothetical protein
VIAEEPHEMLIGDATLGVFDIRPELFITKQGKVTRESDSNYTKFQENEVNNTYLITGVEIYEELLEVLGDIFTPSVHDA